MLCINWKKCETQNLSSSCRLKNCNCVSSRAFCYSLQHRRKLNIWLTCWVSWEPFEGASDDLWPPSCVTGRVRCGIGGLCSVVMATFTLLWGGYSTILSARVDPLAASLQLILNTTSHRLSRAQQGTASCCKKTDFLSPTWSCHTTVWKKSNWSMHMAIVSNLRLIFRKAHMGGFIMWCLDCVFEELELPLVMV